MGLLSTAKDGVGLLSTAKDGGLYFKFINSKKYEIRLGRNDVVE